MRDNQRSSRDVVVVSGASSGIGLATARHLTGLGYTVVAGIRRPGHAERLRAGAPASLIPRRFDVTSDDDVAEAVAFVDGLRNDGHRLRGIFSNAGIEGDSPDRSAEGCSIAHLERALAVNYLGAARFIQGFLPALRADRGTVVVNSALMARLVLPFNGGYAPSKAALESWCIALRREIAPHGVRVSIIELGGITTSMTARAVATPVANPLYPEQMALPRLMGRTMHGPNPPPSMSPDRAAELVARALSSPTPRRRYIGGGGAHVLDTVARLPEAVQDRIFAALLRLGSR